MLKFDLCETLKERVLGVSWNVSCDKFEFQVADNSPEKFSRRSILSNVNSLYDLLGFVAPLVLVARMLQQKIVQRKLGWDDDLPELDARQWRSWFEQLKLLHNLTLSRCFLPPDFGKVVCYQLHRFSDAFAQGYKCVSYLRLVDEKGPIHCSLLCEKARVTRPRPRAYLRLNVISKSVTLCWLSKIVLHKGSGGSDV